MTTFTSGDSTTPTAWTDVSTLTSGLTHANLFNRISTMFKNMRWLYKMLGTTDISAIGDGTTTGAISELNNALQKDVLWQSLFNGTPTEQSISVSPSLPNYSDIRFYIYDRSNYIIGSLAVDVSKFRGTYNVRYYVYTPNGEHYLCIIPTADNAIYIRADDTNVIARAEIRLKKRLDNDE